MFLNYRNQIFTKNLSFFKAFLKNTNQKENINNFLIETCFKKNQLRILSIGAGTGEDILDFLKDILKRSIKVEFVYLDPSKESSMVFNRNTKRLNLSKTVSVCDFESFKTNEKFDLIIASHVFYYLTGWEKTLKKIHKLLKRRGCAYLILYSKRSDLFKIRRKFKHIIPFNEKDTSEKLEKILKKLTFPFKKSSKSSFLNISSSGMTKGEYKNLLSFLLRTNLESLEKNLQFEIAQCVEKISKKSKGKKYLLLVDDFITLNKL